MTLARILPGGVISADVSVRVYSFLSYSNAFFFVA